MGLGVSEPVECYAARKLVDLSSRIYSSAGEGATVALNDAYNLAVVLSLAIGGLSDAMSRAKSMLQIPGGGVPQLLALPARATIGDTKEEKATKIKVYNERTAFVALVLGRLMELCQGKAPGLAQGGQQLP